MFLSQTNSSLSRCAIYLSRSHEGCCSPSLSSGHRAHSSPGGQAYIDAASVTHYLGMQQSVGFCFCFCFSLTFSDNNKILQGEVHSQLMYEGGKFQPVCPNIATVNGKRAKLCCAFAFFFRGGCHRRRYVIPTLLRLLAYCVEGLGPGLMKSEYTLLRLVWPVTVAAEYQPKVPDMGPYLMPLCAILSLHRNWLVRI